MTEERRETPRVSVDKDVEADVSGVRVRLLELSFSGARIEHSDRFPLKDTQLSMTWNLKSVTLPVRVARSEIGGRSEAGLLYRSGVYFIRTTPASDAFIASIIDQMPPSAVEPRDPDAVTEPIPAVGGEPPSVPLPPLDMGQGRKVQPEAVTVPKAERHHTPAQPAPQRAVSVMEPPGPAPAKAAAPQPTASPAPSGPVPAASSASLEDSWIRKVNFLRDDPEDQLLYAQFRLTPNGWEKSYVASPDQPEDGFTVRRGEKDFSELQRTFEWADEDTRRMLRAGLKARMGEP